LRELSIDDSAQMVKDILGARSIYKRFSSRIYSLTYGNPLFIQEVIKNLYSKKIIFIGPSNGVWDSNYNEDYNELPLPLNMEQAVLNQIKEIDDSYYTH
jgi:predicted ATPase